jgi:predicted nucleic acid-binding protein
MITHPTRNPEIKTWLTELSGGDTFFVVPEITDYEVRRELLRANRSAGLQRLNRLKGVTRYPPIDTATMLRAAEFWAEARRQGRPTADRTALDADVILAAQAAPLAEDGHEVTVATTNATHLSAFVDARRWEEIT